MNGAFEISGVGLVAQERALEAIAGNITNINTTAYKRTDVRFSDMLTLSDNARLPRADLSNAPPIASVATRMAPSLDQPGELEATGRPLDLAIDGQGFIELMGPRGQTWLWRGGTLSLDDQRLLTGAGGAPLAGVGSVPTDTTAISINSGGVVTALSDSGEQSELGRITMVTASDFGEIERRDSGVYVPGDASRLVELDAGQDGAGVFVQGAVERSNVDLNQEMVRLMIVQRAYSANAQVLQAADQMMAIANGLRK